MNPLLLTIITAGCILWLGWPLAHLTFYIVRQIRQIRYGDALAEQNRLAAVYRNERLRLENEALHLKIQQSQYQQNNPLALPPIP